MLSSEKLSDIRVAVLGLTGLICLVYACLALFFGDPDPMPFWIPGLAGLASAAIITIAARAAGRKNTRRAVDEGYFADSHMAQRMAYWVALLLYPIFGLLLSFGWVAPGVAFAAMGTLTGAAFLLLFVWFDLRGRL